MNMIIDEPEKYQHIPSVKGFLNRYSEEQFVHIDIEKLFLFKHNVNLLSQNLFTIHQQNGGHTTLHKFNVLTPILMEYYCKKNNLNAYVNNESSSTGQKDWVALLKSINSDFVKYCYKYFKWNNLNPFRAQAIVGCNQNRTYKKFNELMPDDYGTLDVWREQDIKINNSNYRNNNAIPNYRVALHNRNYDRNNEGFRESECSRSSLENYQRTMDMSTIFNAVDSYKDRDWFGM